MSDQLILAKPRVRVMATWKLKEQMGEGWISLDAEYQRGIKWDKEKMSCLIDSIFTGFYIPPLLFAVNSKKKNIVRTVIDGKQRLTAINKFMNNEIPYIHHETNEEKYYCKKIGEDDDDDKEYLSDEELEEFDKFEFLCVEYSDISEDQEYEVFSRVQLGVAITNQEKLKAHNTPVAKICKDLLHQHEGLKNLFYQNNELALFQTILHMFLTLKNDNDEKEFQGTLPRLFTFIKSNYEPTREHINIVKRALTFFEDISANESLLRSLKERKGRATSLKPIDFILFMMYRKKVQRPRTINGYAKDFIKIRNDLYEERSEKIVMGRETFLVGLKLIDDKLRTENLTPVSRPYVHSIVDDSDSDELKEEEYEPPRAVTSGRKVEKRRRAEPGKPTARRGGKSPRGVSRS